MTDPAGPSDSADPTRILPTVRAHYAQIARGSSSCCDASCCGGAHAAASTSPSEAYGYTREDLASAPSGSDLGLGCGNPTALASLRPGEDVLDLGSGAGLDCFLAAQHVGPSGHVIGVDMTPEMVERARARARSAGTARVEFRLGEIEHLPLADASVGVVLSNCVINLSADKRAVYSEAFRVLRPGGRLAVSDVVATRPIPDAARDDPALWSACSSGAIPPAEIEQMLRGVGFTEILIEPGTEACCGGEGEEYLGTVAASIRAVKPGP
ncbi:MAG: arsenite methyltransferase [Thermoplasmata archaeon]|nr:arsenite methyltransferase [Thermoplasmata archaeon]